jgi:diguanylate cyclase (GGDEF)-like protein/PAS domain S-box-containing protein
MLTTLQKFTKSQNFQYILFIVLSLEGVVLVIQTLTEWQNFYEPISNYLLGIIVLLILLENIVGLAKAWPSVWRYFYDLGHLFSFVLLILLLLLPEHPYLIFIRLPRALRILTISKRLSLFKGLTLLKTMRQQWKSQAELRQHQVLLQAIFDRIPVMIVLCNEAGEICLVNHATEKLLGWSNAEVNSAQLWQDCYPQPEQYQRLLAWRHTANGQWQDFSTQTRGGQTVEISWAYVNLWAGMYLGIGQDITTRKTMEARLHWQATHDELTKLLNRQAFEVQLNQAIAHCQAQDIPDTFCYLDMDRFKTINDTCGHIAGDEALRQITTILQHHTRPNDILARLGGDEFGLLLRHCSLTEGEQIAEHIRQAIADYRFMWQGHRFKLGVSIGVMSLDSSTSQNKDVLVAADAACYVAKYNGRNCVQRYSLDDEQLTQQQGDRRWSQRIQVALEADRFYLYAQEIMPLDPDNHQHFYEILLRFVDETGQHLSAWGFLPAAERCGLMPNIDRWVITHFLTVCMPILQKTKQDSKIIYTINLSGASINSELFCKFLYGILQDHASLVPSLCFEITETVAIANLTQATAFMNQLKTLGCAFALDDFGSGMSSLTYLQSLPVDYLKIDGLFIKDIVNNPVNQAMVEGCHRIAHVMGLKTVAEYVENEAIALQLREIGIDYAQGYWVAHPCKLIHAD